MQSIELGIVYMHIYALPYDFLLPSRLIYSCEQGNRDFLKLEPLEHEKIEGTDQSHFKSTFSCTIPLASVKSCVQYFPDPKGTNMEGFVFFQSAPRLFTCSNYPTIYVQRDSTGRNSDIYSPISMRINLLLKKKGLYQGIQPNDKRFMIYCLSSYIQDVKQSIIPFGGRQSKLTERIPEITQKRINNLEQILEPRMMMIEEYINNRNKLFDNTELMELTSEENSMEQNHMGFYFTLEQVAKDCARIDFKANSFFHVAVPLSTFKFSDKELEEDYSVEIDKVRDEACPSLFLKPLVAKMTEIGKISKTEKDKTVVILNYIGCTLIYILVSSFVKNSKKEFVQGMCDYAQFAIEASVASYLDKYKESYMQLSRELIYTFDNRFARLYAVDEPLEIPRIEFTLNDLNGSLNSSNRSPLIEIEYNAYELMEKLIKANEMYIYAKQFDVLGVFIGYGNKINRTFRELNEKNNIEVPGCISWFMLLGLREFRSVEDRFSILELIYTHAKQRRNKGQAIMCLSLAMLSEAVQFCGKSEALFFLELQNISGILRGDVIKEKFNEIVMRLEGTL